jgi:hypothetical protein
MVSSTLASLISGYYDGATELYEYGWGECIPAVISAHGPRGEFPLFSFPQGRSFPSISELSFNSADLRSLVMSTISHI